MKKRPDGPPDGIRCRSNERKEGHAGIALSDSPVGGGITRSFRISLYALCMLLFDKTEPDCKIVRVSVVMRLYAEMPMPAQGRRRAAAGLCLFVTCRRQLL